METGTSGLNERYDLLVGIESETLRVDPDASISELPHPFPEDRSLTTDFAESQLELVTEPHASAEQAIDELVGLHEYAATRIAPERLWPFSIPPDVRDPAAIRLARRGPQDEQRREHLYRRGLAGRYGVHRQLSCGVHVNLGVGPALVRYLDRKDGSGRAVDLAYLRAARHFVRYLDVLVLLTAATPVAASGSPLDLFEDPILSIRNSRAGYGGGGYRRFFALDSVETYVAGIERGLRAVLPIHSRRGLVDRGSPIQLSQTVFQSEKEFYSPVRLRHQVVAGRRQTDLLRHRGVTYLELRFLDRDPYETAGVSADVVRLHELVFLDAVLDTSSSRDDRIDRPGIMAALSAADGVAELPVRDVVPGEHVAFRRIRERGLRLLDRVGGLAYLADNEIGGTRYTDAIGMALARLDDRTLIPAVRIAQDIISRRLSWTEFGIDFMEELYADEHTGLRYAGV